MSNRIETALAVINANVSGLKYIGNKFDSTERIWILSRTDTSSTTYTLLCYDLDGNALATSAVSISATQMYTRFCAIDDYCVLLYGSSARAVTAKVYQLDETAKTLTLIKTSNSMSNYPSAANGFCYKDSSGNYYYVTSTNSSKETPCLVNLLTGAVSRTESSTYRVYCQYFQYVKVNDTISTIRGLFWNSNSSSTMYHCGYKNESSASGAKSLPGTPMLSDGYACYMLPIFRYVNSDSSALRYELYAANYSGTTATGTSTNLIFNSTFTSLTRGSISIANTIPGTYGAILYGGYIYSYNTSTGNIEALAQYDIDPIKIATHAEAVEIGGSGTADNKCILRSQLSSYGCSLKNGRDKYYPVTYKDVRYGDIKGTGSDPQIPESERTPIVLTPVLAGAEDIEDYTYAIGDDPYGSIIDKSKITNTFYFYTTQTSTGPLLQQTGTTTWLIATRTTTGDTFPFEDTSFTAYKSGYKDPVTESMNRDTVWMGLGKLTVANGAYNTDLYSGVTWNAPNRVLVADASGQGGGGGSSASEVKICTLKIYADKTNSGSQTGSWTTYNPTMAPSDSTVYSTVYTGYLSTISSDKTYWIKIKSVGIEDFSSSGGDGTLQSVTYSGGTMNYEYTSSPDGSISSTLTTTITSSRYGIMTPTLNFVELRVKGAWTLTMSNPQPLNIHWTGKPYIELEFTYTE